MHAIDKVFEWNDGTVGELHKLWAQGMSTAAIARELGTSKNSIVGKAHRINLPPRASPINRSGIVVARRRTKRRAPAHETPRNTLQPLPSLSAKTSSAARPVFALAEKVVLPIARTAFVAPPIPSKPLVERLTGECAFPIGDPGSKSFRYCGEPCPSRKPYCEACARRCFAPPRETRNHAMAPVYA